MSSRPKPKRRATAAAKRPRHAVVVGGGIAGLACAILLARQRWRVTVVERDVRAPAATPEEAFRSWVRPGVAQFRHSHTFLARLTCALRERLPDVLTLLRAHGAIELPLTVGTPPGLDLGPRECGDGELVLLGCRRAAFEWALHAVAQREPGVEIREGALVEGLVAGRRRSAEDLPLVTGVRLRELPPPTAGDGAAIPWEVRRSKRSRALPEVAARSTSNLRADLVIDASGRRSRAPEWLRALGAATPAEASVPTGIFYFTRFYRLLGQRPPGASTGLVAGDLGWLKLATFPGDGDTFSITVGTSIDDEPLRALGDPAAFEAVIGAFPQIAPWRAKGISRPIDGARTPVLVMGGLSNRLRSFVRDGKPLAAGFIPLGDAAFHTNPIYGRGATCAILGAIALDDTLRAHPDLVQAALAFDARVRREIEPFWESAAAADRVGRARDAAQAKRTSATSVWSWELLANPDRLLRRLVGELIGAYFERGLVPASRSDGAVYRAVMRVMNMLDEPRSGLLSPAVMARVVPRIVQSLLPGAAPAATAFPGPTRQDALELIAQAQHRARRRSARLRGDAAPRLAPDSSVAGNA